MLSKSKYTNNIAFIDLLFNLLIGIVFLFILAFILINPVAKKEDVPRDAEFLVNISWPDNNPDDVDLWVMIPSGVRIGYSNTEAGITHLEHDDLGQANDRVKIDGKTVTVDRNGETMVIRGIVPGEYKVSVHLYHKDTHEPTPVTVQLIKVNPYSVIYTQEHTFTGQGQMYNFYKFTVVEGGGVADIGPTTESAVGVESK